MHSSSVFEEVKKDGNYLKYYFKEATPETALIYLFCVLADELATAEDKGREPFQKCKETWDSINALVDEFKSLDHLVSYARPSDVKGDAQFSLLSQVVQRSVSVVECAASAYSGYNEVKKAEYAKLLAQTKADLLALIKKVHAKTPADKMGDKHPLLFAIRLKENENSTDYRCELANFFIKEEKISEVALKEILREVAKAHDFEVWQVYLQAYSKAITPEVANELLGWVADGYLTQEKSVPHFIRMVDSLVKLGADLSVCAPSSKRSIYLVIIQSLESFRPVEHAGLIELYASLLISIKDNEHLNKQNEVVFESINAAVRGALVKNPDLFMLAVRVQASLFSLHSQYSAELFHTLMENNQWDDWQEDVLNICGIELDLTAVSKEYCESLFMTLLNKWGDRTNQLKDFKLLRALYEKNPEKMQQKMELYFFSREGVFFLSSPYAKDSYKMKYEDWSSEGLLSDKFIKFSKTRIGARGEFWLDEFNEYPLYVAQAFHDKFIVRRTPKTKFLRFMDAAYRHPEYATTAGTVLSPLKSIEFADGGTSKDLWSAWTSYIISVAPPIVLSKSHKFSLDNVEEKKTAALETKQENFATVTADQLFDDLKGCKIEMQGRTIKIMDEKGNVFAIKVQKKNEAVAELSKEFKALNEPLKDLQSYKPEPVGLRKVEGLLKCLESKLAPKDYANFKAMVEESESSNALLYKSKPDYFIYLHDVKLLDVQFKAANRAVIADLSNLFLQGRVYDQLADMYHNSEADAKDRPDLGRYIKLANLISPMALARGYNAPGPIGSGRLTSWKKAIEFPNIRATGLADWGDHCSIRDFFKDGAKAKKFYAPAVEGYEDRTGNYLLANVLAEYQYVLFLIAGRRGCDLTKLAQEQKQSPEEITLIWKKIADQLVDNCAQMMSVVTNQDEKKVREMLLAQINVARLARQMQFWMTSDYVPHVKNNHIPADIYEEGVEVKVDTSKFRAGTFHPELGFSINGVDQDLGPVNGQEPIKEFDKLVYKMVDGIFLPYQQKCMNREDLFKILKRQDAAKTSEASEKLQEKWFEHLPKEKYHATQCRLYQMRLHSKKLSSADKGRIQSKVESHAATVMQTMWRKRPKNAPSSIVQAQTVIRSELERKC